MPTLRVSPDCELYYVVDDYTDPWREPQTILMMHGNAESGAVWYGWVPHLARRYRVVRPDMRGFGRSSPMPRDYPWSLDRICDDYAALMDALGAERFHVVAAKIGGTIARRFAARFPHRVLTLTLAGVPPPRRGVGPRPELVREIEEKGVAHWARRTMGERLGSRFPPEGVQWWVALMGSTPLGTQLGFTPTIADADVTEDLPHIRCPTLVITTEASALGTVAQTRAWQERIADSELVVLPGDSFHVAATDPDECAMRTLEFIRRRCGG
jgi:pimeloyl-ACP methyl ester carboxylesterase